MYHFHPAIKKKTGAVILSLQKKSFYLFKARGKFFNRFSACHDNYFGYKRFFHKRCEQANIYEDQTRCSMNWLQFYGTVNDQTFKVRIHWHNFLSIGHLRPEQTPNGVWKSCYSRQVKCTMNLNYYFASSAKEIARSATDIAQQTIIFEVITREASSKKL